MKQLCTSKYSRPAAAPRFHPVSSSLYFAHKEGKSAQNTRPVASLQWPPWRKSQKHISHKDWILPKQRWRGVLRRRSKKSSFCWICQYFNIILVKMGPAVHCIYVQYCTGTKKLNVCRNTLVNSYISANIWWNIEYTFGKIVVGQKKEQSDNWKSMVDCRICLRYPLIGRCHAHPLKSTQLGN